MEASCAFETKSKVNGPQPLLTECFTSYALSWLVTLPLEIVAASITVSYWPGARSVNGAAWVTIFLAVIISINLFGVRGYGEAEFVFSIIKVTAVLGFM
jgi:yeast amino acid transporter